MMEFSFNIANITIYILKKDEKDLKISISSLNMQNKENIISFLLILKIVLNFAEEKPYLTFGMFSEYDNRIKLIKMRDINTLSANKNNLLAIINSENTSVYFESSVAKTKFSLTNNKSFIGVEFWFKSLKKHNFFFSDYFVLELNKRYGSMENNSLNNFDKL